MTITRLLPTAADVAIVEAKLDALIARAAKKGIDTDLRYTVAVVETEDGGPANYELTVDYTDLVRFPGGWTLVAVADATGTDEPLIFTLADDVEIAGDVDLRRCDHCGRGVRRTKALFVRDDAGTMMQVGGACALDFLGHDPWWATLLWEAVNDEIDDVARVGAEIEMDNGLVLRAAIEANRLGYVKANAEHGTPTRRILEAMLNGQFWAGDTFAAERRALAEAPAATVTVDAVREWMREQDGDFGANLRRVADSAKIGRKALGIAAYAPAGAMRWREEMAAKAAQRAADEAARADAAPVPVGKATVEGRVTAVRFVENAYGATWKMRVVTDAGWAVWGTRPTALCDAFHYTENGYVDVPGAQIGDRVRFVATIEPAADDPHFGFFKRPTKAEIVERAAA